MPTDEMLKNQHIIFRLKNDRFATTLPPPHPLKELRYTKTQRRLLGLLSKQAFIIPLFLTIELFLDSKIDPWSWLTSSILTGDEVITTDQLTNPNESLPSLDWLLGMNTVAASLKASFTSSQSITSTLKPQGSDHELVIMNRTRPLEQPLSIKKSVI